MNPTPEGAAGGARARIVATLGPASDSVETIRQLLRAGADALRLNFSHGETAWHIRTAERVREAAAGEPVALVADLQGPRVRIGDLDVPVTVSAGDEIELAAGPAPPGSGALPTTYAALAADLKPGDRILVDNGTIELRALDCRRGLVRCRVETGGAIAAHKGINLPGVAVSSPTLTAKDREDVAAAVRLGADYFALSFVRSAGDIELLRRLLREQDADTPIIAKIERGEAVERFNEILAAADAIMVARGDLGIELPEEKVPAIQKQIIAEANALGKPVITATEMLQSMVSNRRPTRAEASDVANAILDGTDAVMLSGETAVGRHPVEAVRMMERIAREAESIRRRSRPPEQPAASPDFTDAVAGAACAAARKLAASALVVFTMSGRTARLVAQRRPGPPILALTPNESTCRRLALVWGVRSLLLPRAEGADAMIAAAEDLLKRSGLVRPSDVVVIVGGSGPLTGTTNFAKIHVVT